jgi:hypothetical protein
VADIGDLLVVVEEMRISDACRLQMFRCCCWLFYDASGISFHLDEEAGWKKEVVWGTTKII